MDAPEGRTVTEAKTREQKLKELGEVIDKMRAAFADVPEDELQAEIDKATKAAREETNRLLKKSKTA
jgi:hypothetical protein